MRLNVVHLDRKVAVLVGALGLAAVATLLVHHFAFAQPAPAFRFATVERGDLQALVSATGTLNAVTTVSVGTQVSGQVSALLVDFNDHVKKGQLLARIDPTLAQQGVADAQANLEKLQAQANQASRDQNRNRELSSARAHRDQRARAGRPPPCWSRRPAERSAARRPPDRRSRTSRTPRSTRPSTAWSSSATSTTGRRSRPASPLRSSS